ncbi:MAG: hypothetical protein QOC67_5711, partial [Pseudonocardiales bacterium]|nr:hypothetical protein [Pseudonocardiales bacterium]
FHSGSPDRASAGCVHLNPADAQAFFNTLQVGNEVQVHKGDDSSDDNSGDDNSDDDGSDDGGGDDGDSGN